MRYIILALALMAGAAQAEEAKGTFGVHTVTYHSPNIDCGNGKNPGIYLRFGNGVELGTYHNSCERQTTYLGYKTPDYKGVSLMTILATGYAEPITPIAAPSVGVRLDKESRLRVSGGSWVRKDVYHLAYEKDF